MESLCPIQEDIKVMAKIGKNNRKRDTRRAARVLDTAEVLGVSPSLVQKVLRTERDNEKVVAVHMELTERHNLLLEEVKKLVPFL